MANLKDIDALISSRARRSAHTNRVGQRGRARSNAPRQPACAWVVLIWSGTIKPPENFTIVTIVQARKKSNQIVTNTGSRNGSENLATNSMNDGIRTPRCSAMALTMKFGPLPM